MTHPEGCLPDSSGADWFKCHRGTVGCPYVHDGMLPHCIECQAGGPCRFEHDPPAVEKPVPGPRSEPVGVHRAT